MGKTQYVIPRNGKWAVRGEGNSRDTKLFDTQEEARQYGRQIAINQGSELVVMGKDGKIRQKDSYGPDKFPPRG